MGEDEATGKNARLSVVQTGIFASALKVVEFYHPDTMSNGPRSRSHHSTDPRTASSASIEGTQGGPANTHGLSKKAWRTAKESKSKHGLEPLLSGPLMVVTYPTISPAHIKTTLSMLSPSEKFPAPKRRVNPNYHEPAVQDGVRKLLFLGARVEGKAFDAEGARWVAGIDGGLAGLRGQLVAMLSSFGGGVTNVLETAGRSLYITIDGRRGMLEEEGKEKDEKAKS